MDEELAELLLKKQDVMRRAISDWSDTVQMVNDVAFNHEAKARYLRSLTAHSEKEGEEQEPILTPDQ